MKILRPGPTMWPKKFRSDTIYYMLRRLEESTYTIGMWMMRRGENAWDRKSTRAWWKVWSVVSRYSAHFGFRFRRDRDELVWYIEEDKYISKRLDENGENF